MIESLFGSKTRVKLLKLFLENTEESYYVREITRKIDEQINSVRRELSNMTNLGIVTSDNRENKLYYSINQDSPYFTALRAMFDPSSLDVPVIKPESANQPKANSKDSAAGISPEPGYLAQLDRLDGLRLAVASGRLVGRLGKNIDLLLVGDMNSAKLKSTIKSIETAVKHELNYSVMDSNEFYYRLSIKDRFVSDIINQDHQILIDRDTAFGKSE